MKRLSLTPSLHIILMGCLIAGAATSCSKQLNTMDPGPTAAQAIGTITGVPGGKIFSVTRFKNNLQNALGASVTQPRGYTFIINKDGMVADSASFGIAYMTGPISNKQHTKQEINIASVTKAMTAVAVMQLMKKREKSLTSTIGEWLPAKWNPSAAVKNLTFGQLLTHSSGITQMGTSWAQVKTTVKGNLDNPDQPADVYANMNFALFRVIIPYMHDKGACIAQEATALSNPIDFEAWLSAQYLEYMQDKVFTPIGLGTVSCKPSPNSAWAYSELLGNNVGLASQVQGDWTGSCGGGGLYMSVLEMARIMAYISHTNILLDATQRNLMDTKYLGWDNEDSPMTIAGRAYGKDGALWWDSNNSTIQDNGDAGLQTFVIKFPNKVELAFAINSIPGSYRNLTTLVISAYNNAWIEP